MSPEEEEKVKKQAKKKKKSKLSGTHSFLVNTSKFIVDKKYHPTKPLGNGAYGVVCSGIDRSRDKKIVIKKIPKTFDSPVDAKRIVREVKLLRHFKHENVIGLRDLVPPPDGVPFEDTYLIMDYMEADLHKIIYSRNLLSDQHVQYFTYQILKGLKYIHSANVIHRDLKPNNLLVNGNCDLKICDFGLARGVNEEEDYELTEYVVTRWYRAPEIMCSCQEYDNKIDIWSVGCIMAELINRKPLFRGNDYIKQMNCIFDVQGTPTEEDMKVITNEKALEYIKSLPKKEPVPFYKVFGNANMQALDLLEKMLQFNPNKRWSVEECLAHPYFKELHNEKAEILCAKPFDFEFEKHKMDKPYLQKLMWEEIYHFRKGLKAKHAKKPHRNSKTKPAGE